MPPRRAQQISEKETTPKSFLSQLWAIEYRDPANRSANAAVLAGIGLFVGGIVFLRTAGGLLVPDV